MADELPGNTDILALMHSGPHILPNQVILAPMVGVADLPYRNLCREPDAGAALSVHARHVRSLHAFNRLDSREQPLALIDTFFASAGRAAA